MNTQLNSVPIWQMGQVEYIFIRNCLTIHHQFSLFNFIELNLKTIDYFFFHWVEVLPMKIAFARENIKIIVN